MAAFLYNATYFKGNSLYDSRNRVHSIKHFIMRDGLLLGMFQGERGERPDLDFVLKYLPVGTRGRLRTPAHTHWIVDLLLKHQIHPIVVRSFIAFYIEQYEIIKPFKTQNERNNYRPYTPNIVLKRFTKLKHTGTFSLEFLAYLIELFIKCEKRTANAFMFKNLLQMMLDYCDGTKDYFQVISHSRRV